MKIQQILRVGLTSTLCSLLIAPPPLYAQIDEMTPRLDQAVQVTEVSEESAGLSSEVGQVESTLPLQATDPTETTSQPRLAVEPDPPTKFSRQQVETLPTSTPELEPVVQPLPSPVVANDPVLISSFKFSQGRGFDYIELFNTSDQIVEVGSLSLRLLYSDATTDYECNLQLDGYMLAEKYLSLAASPVGEILSLPACQQPGGLLFDREIQVLRGETVVESVRILEGDMNSSVESRAWERRGWTGTYREGVLADDFKLSTRPDTVFTSQLYAPPEDPQLEIAEIMIQPKLCSPADPSVACGTYIKFRNHRQVDVDLSLYRLRSAQRDEQPSQYNTSSLTGIVPAGGFLVVSTDSQAAPLALDKSEAAVWLEDKYGVIGYSNPMTPYQKADSTAYRGLVWALDVSDDTWKWGVANPGESQTVFMIPGQGGLAASQDDLTPCRQDQYRNPATNRCRLISTTESELTPCKAGQYRSPETNRCRSVSTASASLTPCNANQYRNPETNRCRAVATTSGLKACPAGQERNPATNRCRKAASSQVPVADFAPELAKGTATVFAAWWALGGVVAAGLAWAGWEYRYEIRRSVGQLLARGKS